MCASVRSVLVAEDYDLTAMLIERFLTRGGYLVDRAEDGRQAVEAAARKRYSLILMDIEMPELDGLQATRIIREDERTRSLNPVPIVALTASTEPGDRERCLAAGCSGYLAKPVVKDRLLEIVAQSICQPAAWP